MLEGEDFMEREGPELGLMLRRLSECPEDFIAVASGEKCSGTVCAIVSDHFREYAEDNPIRDNHFLGQLLSAKQTPKHARFLGLLNVSIWMFHDDWFLERPELAEATWRFLQSDGIPQLSALVKPEHCVSDPDRREEFVRFCLSRIGLRPKDESLVTASDRLASLNSIERKRILQETAEAEKRAREIRKAMEAAKAAESASRYGE
jgi:hypothetical protein